MSLRLALKRPSTRASWRIFTCLTVPSAAPRPRSRARRAGTACRLSVGAAAWWTVARAIRCCVRDPEKGVATVEEALEGARHIVAEMISENAGLRKALRQMMFDEGVVVSKKTLRCGRRAREVQDVLRLPRAGEDHSVASHAGDSPRRKRVVLYFLIEIEAPARRVCAAYAASCARRRLDAATRTGHRRLVEALAEFVDPGEIRSSEAAIGWRGHSGLSRQSA